MREREENLVSIIIPLYNAEQYIIETLESVNKQTYSNYEVLIINDFSTDKSAILVENYIKNKSKFELYNLESNRGVSYARNFGIDKSNGKFIAFLDSDDLWTIDKLEKQMGFMLNNDYVFSCTAYNIFEDEKENKRKIIPKNVLTYDDLLYGNQIACSTVVVLKELINKKYFKECHHEDYLLWLELLKSGHNCYGIDNVLGYYRKSKKSLSGNKLKAATWTWNILYNEQNIGLFKSLKCFFYYIAKALKKHGSIF